MPTHHFTFALEVTAMVQAPTREEAAKLIRRCVEADLWTPLDLASANRGEPAKGVLGATVRVIGRPA